MNVKKRRSNRPFHVHESLGGNMRSCTISQKKSRYLKNASTLGYGKYKVEPGDLITWCYGDDSVLHTGRVMGLVDAPARRTGVPEHDAEAVKGWLCVMRFDPDMTHAYPVWVNPDDVTSAKACPGGKLVAFLLSDEFQTMEIDDLLFLSRYGTLSESYIEGREKVLTERAERAKKEGWEP